MAKIKMSPRAKKLYKKIPDHSGVLQVSETRDFVEFIINRYGDIEVYRVYENGTITMR